MLVDFWAILVFALIVLLFFILFAANKDKTKTNEINYNFLSKDSQFMLDSFLKSPAIGIDSEKKVSDIIIEDTISGDYARTNKLFKDFYKYTYEFGEFKVNDILLEVNGENLDPIIMPDGKNTLVLIVELFRQEIYVRPKAWILDSNEYTVYGMREAKTMLPNYNDVVVVELTIYIWVPN